MKKTRTAKIPRQDDKDMQAEYRFDYSKAKPNRLAAKMDQGSLVVIIEPDVAQVFTTPEEVNAMLRALIAAMPPRTGSESKSKSGNND